jgi:hypothetical protein
MGRTACTEPQCLYKGEIYLFFPQIFGKCLQPWLRLSLCWDLMWRGLVVTGLSEEHIGSVFEEQAVQITRNLLFRI